MDVFIFGQQGAGNTTAARKIVADFIEAQNAPKNCSILVTPEVFGVTHLVTYLQRAEVRVVIFDGIIRRPEDLRRATNALDTLRGRVAYNVLGIYCVQGETKNYISYASEKQI